MSNPYFETWERENLVKFCQEAYDKLQRQEEELQELRWAQQEKSSLADALYERIKEETAAEREACARLCENMTLEWKDQPAIAQAELATLMDCALAIRSRGPA